MIGWKCKIGIFTSLPSNFDTAEYIDSGNFIITTNGLNLSDRDLFASGVAFSGLSGLELAYNSLEEKIGQDIYSFYVTFFHGIKDAKDISDFFPSIYKGFPNLVSLAKNTSYTTLIKTTIYIPSLNRVIFGGSSEWYLYSTKKGSIDKLLIHYPYPSSGGTDPFNQFAYGTGPRSVLSFTQMCLFGYSDKNDLVDDTKRGVINFQVNYNPTTLAVVSSLYNAWCDSPSSPVTTRQKVVWDALFNNNIVDPDFIIEPPPNPYEPGGPSGPTDPDLPPGTFDDESDPIPDSSLPTLSAANTGFTRIYNPTLSQVRSLARYLWTDGTVIETIWNHIKQFFENPMEAIIGFNLVPVPVPDGGTENFALMYIDTGVSMTVAANQFVDLDCGTVELKRYYGSALDQSPYTKVSCYLPYIGTVNLNTDEVMGATLQVKYRVDIVSGSCVAKIFVDGNCLYQYSGHCAITIPISSADFSSYVSAAISVGKLAGAALIGGAGAPAAIAAAEAAQQTGAVTTIETVETARNPSTGRQITTGTTTQTITSKQQPKSITKASFAGLSPQNITNTVGGVMSSKPHIEHSGSFSGNSGYLGVRRPFLIIERPNMCMPENYQALNGFPAMITMELSTCKGFTRVQQVQLTGMGRATNPEQAEILELLKSGVIL